MQIFKRRASAAVEGTVNVFSSLLTSTNDLQDRAMSVSAAFRQHQIIIMIFLSFLILFTANSNGLSSVPNRVHSHSKAPDTTTTTGSRRRFLESVLSVGVTASSILLPSTPSQAAVTDETDNFSDNWWSSSSDPPSPSAATKTTIASSQSSLPIASDEVEIAVSKTNIAKSGLGIELADIEFRTNLRVYVKSVAPDRYASTLGIRKDWILVAINNQSTERTNAQGVTMMIQQAVQDRSSSSSDTLTLRFRDTSVFQEKLQALKENESVTTQVAPGGDTTQRNKDGSVKTGRVETSQADQRITVTQLVAPKLCNRGATPDDLLEISYVGRVLETGKIFDGSAVRINSEGIPGRGNDVSLYFVLNKQPFGQFPPGWDVGLNGMCVGERRRVIIPPALAYGSIGVPRRGIPPDATLQYDVSLVSLNGLSTPQ